MFVMCESMKWNHLPNGGGLYEQDPDLLDGFLYIFGVRSEYEEKKNAERESEAKRAAKGQQPRR